MLPWSTWVYMGGFWLGHFGMIRENSKNWKMGILHFRTGTWILRPESLSVTCNSLFVGLPLLQVRQSPGLEHWMRKSYKKKRKRALRNRVWLTHTHTYIYIYQRVSSFFRHDNLDVPHKHGWYYGMVLHGMVWYEWWVWFLLAYGVTPPQALSIIFWSQPNANQ